MDNYEKALQMCGIPKDFKIDVPQQKPSIASQFTGLPMEDLIGGPLRAIEEANGTIDRETAKAIIQKLLDSKKDDKK